MNGCSEVIEGCHGAQKKIEIAFAWFKEFPLRCALSNRGNDVFLKGGDFWGLHLSETSLWF